MITHATLMTLAVALVLYSILGGADFGAGALELFKGRRLVKEQEDLITHALAPVWEANHMWIVLAVVILFNGFPAVYATLATAFHIPLTLMLLGIVLRGCAFAFRHYDPVAKGLSAYYSLVFAAASSITPAMMGLIAGGLLTGRVRESATTALPAAGTFYELYISPWLSPFTLCTALFYWALCVFVAAVFLIGESDDEALRRLFRRRAIAAEALCVLSGLACLASASYEGIALTQRMLNEPLAYLAVGTATATILGLWYATRQARISMMRLLAGVQMAAVLTGWFAIQYPFAYFTDRSLGQGLSFYAAAASPASMRQLALALLVGGMMILPALVYLLRTFKAVGAEKQG